MICDTCAIRMAIDASAEPACCEWYMEHVVILGEPVEACSAYSEATDFFKNLKGVTNDDPKK